MQIIDRCETEKGLPFDRLIPALEKMFVEGCDVPLRHSHTIGKGTSDEGVLLIMPAWQQGKRLGVKTVSVFPGNGGKGLPGLHSTFMLFDATTGEPVAMLDGDVITSRRTAAASALAAKFLAREDARSLLIVGAGRVASLLPYAYRAVRDIRTIMVWDVNPVLARRLVDRLNAEGIQAGHAQNLEEAVGLADITTCATLSTAPLIKGEWLAQGSHLDLIGGFTPAMRESDDVCFRRATVFIDTDEALMKSGDLLEPIRSGAFAKEQVASRLDELCRGDHTGRSCTSEITLFKAVGTALEDLAAASLAYDEAESDRRDHVAGHVGGQ